MTSRAQIAPLTKTDPALVIPYRGEQWPLGTLQARGVTFTAEDYKVIRQALGDGKRGRARARELVPLQCPRCACRLTLFDRSGREPYFAPTDDGASHGPECDVDAPIEPARSGTRVSVSEAVVVSVRPPDHDASSPLPIATDARRARTIAASDAPGAAIGAASAADTIVRQATSDASPAAASPEFVPPSDLGDRAIEPADYVIHDTSVPSPRRALHPALATPVELAEDAQHATVLAGARELLTLALNRAVPPNSRVCFRGQRYAITPAAELHRLRDGEQVAVYGRLTELEWNEAFGRLTLRATPKTVQVWATSAAPRRLLALEAGTPIGAPVLRRPVPFLAFGTLKKLNAVCGIPVVRSDMLTLLQPLVVSHGPTLELSQLPQGVSATDGMTLLPTASERNEPRPHAAASDVGSPAFERDMDPTDVSSSESSPLQTADVVHPTADMERGTADTSEADAQHVVWSADTSAADPRLDTQADGSAADSKRAATDAQRATQEGSSAAAQPGRPSVDASGKATASSSRSKTKRGKRQRTTSRSIAAGVGRGRSRES
jgi:hypothetical protein